MMRASLRAAGVMGVALFGAAVFKTDVLRQPPSHSMAHVIHQMCSTVGFSGSRSGDAARTPPGSPRALGICPRFSVFVNGPCGSDNSRSSRL